MEYEENKKVVVLESNDTEAFEDDMNMYLEQGYDVSSSSCGFVNSEQYEFCSSYQAILVLKLVK